MDYRNVSWEMLVEDYTSRFVEKGIDESVARAMAEKFADADIAIDRILDANCLDIVSGENLDRFFISNFDEETKQ